MSGVNKGINDIATVYPDLVMEWDEEKNNGITPDCVSAHSNKKYWWKCSKGHSFDSSPDKRARGMKDGRGFTCPICSGKRVLEGYNDLKSQAPALEKDWDYEKNVDIKPNEITVNSNKKVWWKCHICGYSWFTSPNRRGGGKHQCLMCARKQGGHSYRLFCLKKGENDLVSLFPNLMEEWDYEKNKGKDPEIFTINSSEKVWWKCYICNHNWEATISNRCAKKSGCPYCSGRIVVKGENDLETWCYKNNPKLLQEWNYEKNDGLIPSMFSKRSNKSIWWICSRGHEWKAKIEARTYGRGCPECSKNLRTSFPEQAIFYYLSKQFNAENRFRVNGWEADIFLPEYNIAIEYDGMLYHSDEKAMLREARKNKDFAAGGVDLIRVKEVSNKKEDTYNILYLIPRTDYLSLNDVLVRLFEIIERRTHRKINIIPDIVKDKAKIYSNFEQYEKENNITNLFPNVVKDWDYERNINLKPEMFVKSSTTRVWWICKNNHSYLCSIVNKINVEEACPYCSNRKTKYGVNDITTTDSWILKEWNYDKNNNVLPEKYNKQSRKKVWWKCDKGHEYEAIISSKIKGLTCPYCNNRLVLNGYNDLKSKYPELAKEWNYEKNDKLKPEDVLAGGRKKVWWICSEGHEWQAEIIARTKEKSGCPYCAHQKFRQGYNDLKSKYPKLSREWNYEKNGDLKPDNVLAGGRRKVWWKCSKGHEWQAEIYSRIYGRNCPYCSNKKLLIGYNDFATVYPELVSEWDYEKNGDLKPEKISCGSMIKVWWKCKKGHEWFISPNQRRRPDGTMSQCKYCSGKIAIPGETDLGTVRPDLVKEWNYKKNKAIKPSDVKEYSAKKVWWICSVCGFEWEALISNRSNGAGCPKCGNIKKGKKM